MNPRLELLHPYPFQKLRELFAGVTPNPDLAPINLSIGEPKHPTPQFIKDALVAGLDGLWRIIPSLRVRMRYAAPLRHGRSGATA